MVIEVSRYMAEPEALSDIAIVLRGGRNRPGDVYRGIGTIPSGIMGGLVECEDGISVQAPQYRR